MKLLPGSSSSLLLSVLLAQLPLFTSAFPAHARRPYPDFDKLTNQTKHLQRMTQDLINAHKSDDLTQEQHRFKSLPAINSKANDLSSLELKGTLSQLHADLRSFEQHFDWLNKVTQKHPLAFKLGDIISQIRILTNLIHRQMLHVDAPRLQVASPTLPHQPLSQWEMIQSSQVLLQRFRLFCDWAARAFLSLKSKM